MNQNVLPHPAVPLDPDLTAHELDELPCDRQPQAGAAVAPGHRASTCENGWKEPVLVRRDADAGVAHREGSGPGRAQRLNRDPPHDLALGRELHGVADQVQQHLAQPAGVALHRLGMVGMT